MCAGPPAVAPPPPQLVNEQVVYTKDQAQYYLNLKPGTIRLAVRCGQLKAHKRGGRYYTEVTRVFPTTRHPLDAVFPMPPGVIWVRTEALRRRLVLQRKPMTAVTELPAVSTLPLSRHSTVDRRMANR